MSLVDEIKKCKTTPEALLLLAKAIDEQRDYEPVREELLVWDDEPGTDWDEPVLQTDEKIKTEYGAGRIKIIMPDSYPPVQKINVLKVLDKCYPNWEAEFKTAKNINRFEEGLVREGVEEQGGVWLWFNADNKWLYDMPQPCKRAIVADIDSYDNETALDVGRSLLKVDPDKQQQHAMDTMPTLASLG